MPLSRDGDKDDNKEGTEDTSKDDNEVTILYEMTSADCNKNGVDSDTHDLFSSSGSKLAVDEEGIVYLIACPSSLTLFSQEDGHVVGTLALDRLQRPHDLSSISFGEDGYLYITSPNELMCVKSHVGGVALPINVVVSPPLKYSQSKQGAISVTNKNHVSRNEVVEAERSLNSIT